jgi:hypothetical protein
MHLVLGLIGQTTIGHLIEVLRYLILHSIADTFVFLDAGEDLRELCLIFLAIQVMNHTYHSLRTDSEHMNLFPCLQDRQLGR